jgi:hypothetical protein
MTRPLPQAVLTCLYFRKRSIMSRALFIAVAAFVTAGLLGAGEAWAHPSWGIVVDRRSQVYFSDLETVWKIDAAGKLSVFRAGVSGRHIHELAGDEEGNIYGPDYSYVPARQTYLNAVWRMTTAGAFTYVLAPTESMPRGMSIWRDREGNTYSYEQNNNLKRETLLLKRTPGGEVFVFAGGAYGHADGKGARARFSSIVGMAFGPEGDLYLSDGASVRRVAPDGTVSTLADGLDVKGAGRNPVEGEIRWGGLMGLTVGARGEVYAADYRNRRVLKITPGGEVSTAAQTEPPWTPTGVALSAGGDLYILEFGTTPSNADKPRVRKLSPDGRVMTVAAVGQSESTREVAPAAESPEGAKTRERVESGRGVPYLFLCACAGAVVLTLVAFSLYRRSSGRGA